MARPVEAVHILHFFCFFSVVLFFFVLFFFVFFFCCFFFIGRPGWVVAPTRAPLMQSSPRPRLETFCDYGT